ACGAVSNANAAARGVVTATIFLMTEPESLVLRMPRRGKTPSPSASKRGSFREHGIRHLTNGRVGSVGSSRFDERPRADEHNARTHVTEAEAQHGSATPS